MKDTPPKPRIEVATGRVSEDWNECLERSPHGNPFQQYEALEILAQYSNTTPYPLVGYEGGEPIGVFPAFEVSKAGVKAIFSPPPYSWIQYLGPVVVPPAMDETENEADSDSVTDRNTETDRDTETNSHDYQHQLEARHLGFVEACLDWLESEIGPRYVHVHTDPDYVDPRPFAVNDFGVRPRYTYEVDLALDRDDLLMTFASDARSNVRSGDDVDYTIREGDGEDAEWIIEQVAKRYDEQGKSYGVQPEMVRKLYERLPEGSVRPYVCSVRGDPTGGMVAFENDDTIYRWQGGMKTDTDVPVNDLLDWHIMCDAMERGVERYDLVGAENQRINRYKSKFNPELSAYYTLKQSSKPVKLAAEMYDQLGKLK